MSGIGGILRFDRSPIEAAEVAALVAGLIHRGPEGVERWDGNGVTLVHAMFRATPEADHECQPLSDASGKVWLTFDGRLDNRDELLAETGVSQAGPGGRTDPSIVLQAYLRWDRSCVSHLLGDYAFAIWDERHRRLFCGRDPLGLRPFVYRLDARRFAWASEIHPLLALPGRSVDPNLGMLGEYLADAVTSRHETVYQGILRLPPAHVLTVEGRTVQMTRHWDVNPDARVVHRSHGEYAEHVREVLGVAVRSRLRARGPIAVELSGGIDSSAIVGIAETERRNLPGADAVRALSMVYPGRDCDERAYIDEVSRMWDIEPVYVLPPAAGTYDFGKRAQRIANVPDYAVLPSWTPLYDRARDLGSRVVLNGIGADEFFTGSVTYAADLLSHRRLRELTAQARVAARWGYCSTPQAVFRYGLRPLVTRSLPPVAVRTLRSRFGTIQPRWIRPAFARSIDLRDRLTVAPRDGCTFAQAQFCRSLDGGSLPHSFETLDRFVSDFGLELRLPFLDTRVITLALAVPEAQRWGTDRPKRLLRTAVSGLVPQSVVNRTDKPGPSYLAAEELLSASTAALFRAPLIEQRGWVDGDKVRAMHNRLAIRYRQGLDGWENELWPLWRLAAVEIWLQTIR